MAGTEFEKLLRAYDPSPVDSQLRHIAFHYCQQYQESWSFEQLEDAFEYLAARMQTKDSSKLHDELLPAILDEVELAMGEYFESLNEVATAVHRLLDDRPFSIDDTLKCVSHVWKAHSLNELGFEERENQNLCRLLKLTMANEAIGG